jgi:valyl-tRNA synthetase
MEMPNKYETKACEEKWTNYWITNKIFSFNSESEDEIYSIDSPPPTVSGNMHIGHAFSFSHMDFIARYKRMKGYNVFFPFGTDDNGIATERLVEKINKVKASRMQRHEFTKLCLDTLEKIRPTFILDWKKIGMSYDWDIFYSTIDKNCQKINQESFIDLYKKGREYRKDAPVLWCPLCQTALSQVECEDKESPSYFNDIIFKVGEEELIIGTTRPEFLAACSAIFFHPEDPRFKKYKGKKAIVPIYEHEVPILCDERVQKDKGTGIVMCCTFGDQTDIEWFYAYDLELRPLLSKDGKLTEIAKEYSGLNVKEARLKIIEELTKQKLLIKQNPIQHSIKVHERCKTEIEIIHSKQWFIKYLDIKDKMLKWGKELNWYPKHMRVRYDNWIKGLQWDWLISRQRYSGIPFPVWYCEKCDEIILANEKDLPVDPIKDKPPVNKCPKCGHEKIIPETDVQDTWATSSLTPQIATSFFKDKKIYDKLYPMNLRAQAHDIITFWLFNTVVKSQLHNHVNPWNDVIISGHAQDPHGKKMSKSLGNVVEPQKMIEKYSADALRYWSAGSKLGDDLPFQEKDLVTGTKFCVKLWNASKFSFMHLKEYEYKDAELEIMDRWLLSKLNNTIKNVTESFDNYDYSKAKREIDNFFWNIFCNNFLEIAKDRLYNPDIRGEKENNSAKYSLYKTLNCILKMIAPIMPYITEEIYQYYFIEKENKESIHLCNWPEFEKELIDEEAERIGDMAVEVIETVRKKKSDEKLSMKTPVKKIIIEAKITDEEFEMVKEDILSTTNAQEIEFIKIPLGTTKEWIYKVEL